VIERGYLKIVRLYGKLGVMFGRRHDLWLETGTVGEAMRALIAQYPGLGPYLTGAKDKGIAFAVFIGKRNISREYLGAPTGDEDIRIAPILVGSKNGGIFQIIVGVVLVLADVLVFHTGYIATVGYGMIVGGVVQLLTPVPKGLHAKDAPANQPSYAFNGPVNTQAQGNPVPLLYGGPMKIGSAVISAGITTEDHAVAGPIGGNGSMGAVRSGYNLPVLAP
jgi:predicted phage tail protein